MAHTVYITDESSSISTAELEIIDPTTGVDYSADLVLGNTHGVVDVDAHDVSRIPDGGIGVDDAGNWYMSEDTHKWWATYIEGEYRLDDAKADLTHDELDRFGAEFPGVDMEDECRVGLALVAEIIADRE